MFIEEELIIIKNALADELNLACKGNIAIANAKDLAYLSPSKFNEIDSFRLKWTQSALKKVIQTLVDLNGTD